jgi:CheY-like chemotaxis protein
MCKTLSVIVVDDQRDIAESTAKLVRLYGHQVHAFNSGRAVLEALEDLAPDIVLSDIRMPEMDGCELAIRIRQRPGFENLILAAVSGFEDEDIRRATAAAGFDYQFLKPIGPADLKHFIAEVVKHCDSAHSADH